MQSIKKSSFLIVFLALSFNTACPVQVSEPNKLKRAKATFDRQWKQVKTCITTNKCSKKQKAAFVTAAVVIILALGFGGRYWYKDWAGKRKTAKRILKEWEKTWKLKRPESDLFKDLKQEQVVNLLSLNHEGLKKFVKDLPGLTEEIKDHVYTTKFYPSELFRKLGEPLSEEALLYYINFNPESSDAELKEGSSL